VVLFIRPIDFPVLNWHVITQSTHVEEPDTLGFMRAGLFAGSHAFANFTFTGLDGSLDEVNLLVIGPWGFIFAS
jgi:hypothetical protein